MFTPEDFFRNIKQDNKKSSRRFAQIKTLIHAEDIIIC